LEDDVRPYFRFRDEDAVYMFDVDTPARGDLMVERAAELIHERFAGTGKKVLMVSHYHTGSRLMTALLGEHAPRFIRPANAGLAHLQEAEDGTFRLRLLNDRTMRTDW